MATLNQQLVKTAQQDDQIQTLTAQLSESSVKHREVEATFNEKLIIMTRTAAEQESVVEMEEVNVEAKTAKQLKKDMSSLKLVFEKKSKQNEIMSEKLRQRAVEMETINAELQRLHVLEKRVEDNKKWDAQQKKEFHLERVKMGHVILGHLNATRDEELDALRSVIEEANDNLLKEQVIKAAQQDQIQILTARLIDFKKTIATLTPTTTTTSPVVVVTDESRKVQLLKKEVLTLKSTIESNKKKINGLGDELRRRAEKIEMNKAEMQRLETLDKCAEDTKKRHIQEQKDVNLLRVQMQRVILGQQGATNDEVLDALHSEIEVGKANFANLQRQFIIKANQHNDQIQMLTARRPFPKNEKSTATAEKTPQQQQHLLKEEMEEEQSKKIETQKKTMDRMSDELRRRASEIEMTSDELQRLRAHEMDVRDKKQWFEQMTNDLVFERERMRRVISGRESATRDEELDALRNEIALVKAESEANVAGLVSIRERNGKIEGMEAEILKLNQGLESALSEKDRADGMFSIMEDIVAEVGGLTREMVRKRVRGAYYNAGDLWDGNFYLADDVSAADNIGGNSSSTAAKRMKKDKKK